MKSSINQSIKPITAKINENNNLEIGGCDLVDLANKKGFEIYQRKLNLSGSKIMVVKLWIQQ